MDNEEIKEIIEDYYKSKDYWCFDKYKVEIDDGEVKITIFLDRHMSDVDIRIYMDFKKFMHEKHNIQNMGMFITSRRRKKLLLKIYFYGDW